MKRSLTRRRAMAGVAGVGAALLTGRALASPPEPRAIAASRGRLLARPRPIAAAPRATGLQPLHLATGPRDGLLYVPPTYDPTCPSPLVVTFHGAGGEARHGIDLLRAHADAARVILLAPDARRATWDLVHDDYGPDVAFLDRALEEVFAACAIDPARVGVAGFSDGGTYALSLGIDDGDLFSAAIGFSPGFVAPHGRAGRPRFFVSHGTNDGVLPIDRCGRRVARSLRAGDYNVTYREFEGAHAVPFDVAREALAWFLGPTS